MNRINQLRVALDKATDGGLYALNKVSIIDGLTPHLVIQTEGLPQDYTRIVFFATDGDEVRYFDTALIKGKENRFLSIEIQMVETVRNTKKQIARVNEQLAQFETEDDEN
jgi:hypothetical protein